MMRLGRAMGCLFAVMVFGLFLGGPFGIVGSMADEPDTIKIGVVSFLSGPAAAAPGIPGANGAQLIIDAINEGELPPPLDSKGLGGRRIEAVLIDETGGSTRQVTEFRNMVQRRGVELVVGYITVADCNAIAPVADELEVPVILTPCGTSIFEGRDFAYAFQTINSPVAANVGAARFIHEQFPDARAIAGINPNYAFGQDNWRLFLSSMKALEQAIEPTKILWPKLFAGQYGAEITTLLASRPQIIHSALWGGDMQAFIFQATSRGLFTQSRLLMAAGLHVLPLIEDRLPDGAIVTTLGPLGRFMERSEVSEWFIREYGARYGSPWSPAATAYADAMLGVKAAFDLAHREHGDAFTMAQVVKAVEGLEWQGVSGKIRMAGRNGHQAITGTAIGYSFFDEDEGQTVVRDIVRYSAECVNPPSDMTSRAWIEAGFPGAKCD